MTRNKETVEAYMEAFRKTDRERILACLTDDVEWLIPGAFHVQGKEAFNGHILDEGFAPYPEITVSRLIEGSDTVVAEGSVLARRTDGAVLSLVFCDVFEMRDGRIRKLISYLMQLQ